MGAEEAAALRGTDDPDGVRELLRAPSELVVQDGAGPAVALADGQRYAVAAPAVEVVEPVRAGDAFAAGYLAARRFGGSSPCTLRRGRLPAAAVLARAGRSRGAPGPPGAGGAGRRREPEPSLAPVPRGAFAKLSCEVVRRW
ncbi:PfkB family carbohydrate kinase [Streptomyces sp. NPDC048179]|uniref:PfkB family carbohydrate kinase n=1 Tax=Streptomyces sp. NPDC048179 TaxID=3365506 RepID=UPI00371B152F